MNLSFVSGKSISYDESSEESMSVDMQKSDHVNRKIKRSATILKGSDDDSQIERKKRRVEVREGEVIEFLRDDAFFIGLRETHRHVEKQIKQDKEMEVESNRLDIKSNKKRQAVKIESDVSIDEHQVFNIVPLRKIDEKSIKDIQETKGFKISQQFSELYQMLTKAHLLNHENGQNILDFAFAIISEVPDRVNPIVDEDEPIDELYIEMAERFYDEMNITATDAEKTLLARSLQKGVKKTEEESIDSTDDNPEDSAIENLGLLLLVMQHDIKEAADCIVIDDLSLGLKNLYECAVDIINLSKKNMKKHSENHLNAAIQDHKEALFHQMSIEMADLILLDTGSINFGMMDIISELLIPEEFESLLAIKNLHDVMSNLASTSSLWSEIARVNVPTSVHTPSTLAIRTCLNLSSDIKITQRHAQIFVLSAILGHYRQAKVGSCFATACLIKALHYHLDFFIQDLKKLTEEGRISRVLYGEERHFPYIARTSKEFLDTLVEVDNDGYLLSTTHYDKKPYELDSLPKPKNTYLYDAPGIVAAAQAMNIKNIQEAVLDSIPKLEKKFSINELLKMLANHAWRAQEASRYHLRFEERLSENTFFERGQFAFGSQMHHPLHIAYDQTAASMVNYFGTQYAMPIWIHDTICDIIKMKGKGLSLENQRMINTLKGEIFLPLIIRMRFRYNPHIDDTFKLFNDGNHGVDDDSFYGYELCDGGLPKDFTYSQELYKRTQKDASWLNFERFKEYPPEHLWKLVNTEEKFQEFIQNIVSETVNYLITHDKNHSRQEWRKVEALMRNEIDSPSFGKRMIHALLGKQSDQKKDLNKNPHHVQTAPWTFRWGGDFDAVMQSYFGFAKKPSKMKSFNGSQKEVLAKCINFIKNQPEKLKNDLTEGPSMLLMVAPVHAFLLKPDESSYVEAVTSDMSTNDYIAKNVEIPGLEIANSRLNLRGYKEIIDFIAENQWVCRYNEKNDFIRQKLTAHSKEILDQLIEEDESLLNMSNADFQKKLIQYVAKARAADPMIEDRNSTWEQQFAKGLHNYFKTLESENDLDESEIKESLITFARDQEDSMALSANAIKLFLNEACKIPSGLSIKDFRQAVVNAASLAHESDVHMKDGSWKIKLSVVIDNRLFAMLTNEKQEQLLNSAIITHDPNWREGIYDFRTGFMVNPGSGKLEFCRFLPDLKKVNFFEQNAWFPTGTKHGSWQFPDNYRTYASAPLFNVKKYTGIL